MWICVKIRLFHVPDLSFSAHTTSQLTLICKTKSRTKTSWMFYMCLPWCSFHPWMNRFDPPLPPLFRKHYAATLGSWAQWCFPDETADCCHLNISISRILNWFAADFTQVHDTHQLESVPPAWSLYESLTTHDRHAPTAWMNGHGLCPMTLW